MSDVLYVWRSLDSVSVTYHEAFPSRPLRPERLIAWGVGATALLKGISVNRRPQLFDDLPLPLSVFEIRGPALATFLSILDARGEPFRLAELGAFGVWLRTAGHPLEIETVNPGAPLELALRGEYAGVALLGSEG